MTTPIQKQPRGRNEEIELLRILLAIMVVFVHTERLVGTYVCQTGFLAVDTFFMLSGYLMMAHAQRADSLPTMAFLWRKIQSFLPETIMATIIGCIVLFYATPVNLKEATNILLQSVLKDVFLLKMTGIISLRPDANGVTWFLSSLMIGMAILYPYFRRHEVPFFVPVGSLLLLGYILHECSGFAKAYEWIGVTYMGNLRALAELSLGAYAYMVVPHVAAIKFHIPAQWCIGIFKYGLIVSFLLLAWRAGHIVNFQIYFIIATWLFIVLSFAGVGGRISHPLFLWLGKLSLPLYLGHGYWARSLRDIMPDVTSNVEILLIYTGLSLATALFLLYTARIIRNIIAVWRI